MRRRKFGVSEQFLNAAQIRAAIQQMGGEGVAKHVRMDMPVKARLLHQPVQNSPHRTVGQPGSPVIDQQGPFVIGPFRQIYFQRLHGGMGKGTILSLLPFPLTLIKPLSISMS